MEEKKQQIPNSRISRLRQSYACATHSLLNACSKEDFLKIVSSFKESHQEALYELYFKTIPLMHENIQVMAALGTIEQLIESKKFDVLHEDNTSANDVKQEIAKRKLGEIHYLTNMLEKEQEQNENDEKKLEALRKSGNYLPNANSAVFKLKEYNGALQEVSQRIV